MDRGGENKDVYQKQWQLQPESEYRFELDPGKSLAIKVCAPTALYVYARHRAYMGFQCPLLRAALNSFF